MSKSLPPSRITIPPEIEAEMTPAVKAFMLAAFAALESRIEELEQQIQRLTPQNSSLPPSTQNRSVYDFLVAAVTASYRRQPAPSLLPAK